VGWLGKIEAKEQQKRARMESAERKEPGEGICLEETKSCLWTFDEMLSYQMKRFKTPLAPVILLMKNER
jgi:hypothetical protein